MLSASCSLQRRQSAVRSSCCPVSPSCCCPPCRLQSSSRPIFQSSSLPVFQSSHLPVFQSSCLPVVPSSSLPVFLSSSRPVFQPSSLPVFQSSSLPFFQSSSPPVFLSSSLSAFQSSSLSALQSSCLPVLQSSCLPAVQPSSPGSSLPVLTSANCAHSRPSRLLELSSPRCSANSSCFSDSSPAVSSVKPLCSRPSFDRLPAQVFPLLFIFSLRLFFSAILFHFFALTVDHLFPVCFATLVISSSFFLLC